MHRIDGPGATVDNHFTEGDPVGGVEATTVTDDWLNDVQEELISILDAAGITPVKGTQNQVLTALRSLATGVVGSSKRKQMMVSAVSASGTFTAEQVVVGAALNGPSFKLSNLNLSINLGGTGAGGMDSGTATANGWVGIYLIYNPATNTAALLGKMESVSAVLPSVYSGAFMPAGYTASALGCIAPTHTVAGQFAQFLMTDNYVEKASVALISSSTFLGLVARNNPAAMPYSARYASGINQAGGSAAAAVSQVVSPSNSTLGGQNNTFNVAAGSSQAIPFKTPIFTPQTAWVFTSLSTGTGSFSVFVVGYEF